MDTDFPTTDKSNRSGPPTDLPTTNNADNILYLTFGLIFLIIIIWIIIVSTSTESIKILPAMNNLALQIPPVSDKIK